MILLFLPILDYHLFLSHFFYPVNTFLSSAHLTNFTLSTHIISHLSTFNFHSHFLLSVKHLFFIHNLLTLSTIYFLLDFSDFIISYFNISDSHILFKVNIYFSIILFPTCQANGFHPTRYKRLIHIRVCQHFSFITSNHNTHLLSSIYFIHNHSYIHQYVKYLFTLTLYIKCQHIISF